MDSIVELVKRNEQLLLENAEALNDEEVEQEDIDEYLNCLLYTSPSPRDRG